MNKLIRMGLDGKLEKALTCAYSVMCELVAGAPSSVFETHYLLSVLPVRCWLFVNGGGSDSIADKCVEDIYDARAIG